MLFQGRVGIFQVLGHCPLFGLLWLALELSRSKGEWQDAYTESIIGSDMQMTPPLCRKQRGTKKPLDESEREE